MLLSACDYDPHSNHTFQVCEHNNSTAHSAPELISGQLKEHPLHFDREVSVCRISFSDSAVHSNLDYFIFYRYTTRDMNLFGTKFQLFA